MRLLNPINVRLSDEQDAWVEAQAEAAGHASKSLILRGLITQAMRQQAAATAARKPKT